MPLILIAFILSLVITILSFIAISLPHPDLYLGCNTDNKSLLSAFNKVDDYLIQVDSILCSSACPCKILNEKDFISDIDAYEVYKHWITSKDAPSINYQTCAVNIDTTMNEKNFIYYYSGIENRFECTGFCKTRYHSDSLNTNVTIYKYLFTDVNRYLFINTEEFRKI
jgi:hypothetical protein